MFRVQASVDTGMGRERASKLPLIISILAIACLIASYFIFPGYQEGVNEAFEVLTSDDEERIREWVSQFGAWGPVAILLAMVAQMFFFIIPNILLIVISILCYGPVWGSVLAWFGIFLASTVGYFIGNRLGGVMVNRLVSKKIQMKLRDFVKAYGMKAVVVLRVSSLSNDGLSLVAGVLNMDYRRFIAATLIGITPLITALAIFGRNGNIRHLLVWVGVFLVACLVIYVIIDKRKQRKNSSR
jgi:uncharacterized membrane protein YdjX (TVP38/TMEM64 family)